MATGMLVKDLTPYLCPVCYEVFDNPVRINCGNGHIFCLGCVEQCSQFQSDRGCPVCRLPFHLQDVQCAMDVKMFIDASHTPCLGCQKKIPMSHIKLHEISCKEMKLKESEYAKSLKHEVPKSPTANRHTFSCPYCSLQHLDQEALIKHCNQSHSNDKSQVVCPICTSMPWGDPNYRSGNFLQHLNVRHQFEYDTYVDFQQDDDAMMAAAIAASMKEK